MEATLLRNFVVPLLGWLLSKVIKCSAERGSVRGFCIAFRGVQLKNAMGEKEAQDAVRETFAGRECIINK